jgi:hypothetical protein|tara:strand:- start:1758 stop:2510 length:753 start_codon:yes stop_codon:yes gene_type:complete
MKIRVKKELSERKWNKDSETPRDYSKEYNKPGSKEQEERNKRKRDKRKHDKEFGECPEGTELHHINGIESDEVKCVPVSKNRGRKEKSRKKDGEIVITIMNQKGVKKINEARFDFYGSELGSGGIPKQKKATPSKSLDVMKRELVAKIRKTRIGSMNFRDEQEFEKRLMKLIDDAVDSEIENLAKDYEVVGRKMKEQELKEETKTKKVTIKIKKKVDESAIDSIKSVDSGAGGEKEDALIALATALTGKK